MSILISPSVMEGPIFVDIFIESKSDKEHDADKMPTKSNKRADRSKPIPIPKQKQKIATKNQNPYITSHFV